MKRVKSKEVEKVVEPEPLTDSRKITAAQILAYAGYEVGVRKAGFGSVSRAAKEAGVTRQLLYNWLKDESFVASIQMYKEDMLITCVSELMKLVKKGNVTAIIYRLSTLRPEEFDQSVLRLKFKAKYDRDLLEEQKKLAAIEIE